MKWKHLALYLSILIGTVAIGKIVKALTFGFSNQPETASDFLLTIFIASIVIIGCVVIARKNALMESGGFRGGNRRNYWMLILPVLFPGILFIGKVSISCVMFNFFYVIMIVHVLISGVMEECLFRGVILGHLRQNYPGRSIHFSCIVSSLLFSLMHLVNLQFMDVTSVLLQLIYAFMIGMLLAGLMVRIGNVWLLGIVHGVLNFFTSGFCNQDVASTVTKGLDQSLHPAWGILFFLLAFSPALIIYFLLINSYKKKVADNSAL